VLKLDTSKDFAMQNAALCSLSFSTHPRSS
jgi:hypothetical protein